MPNPYDEEELRKKKEEEEEEDEDEIKVPDIPETPMPEMPTPSEQAAQMGAGQTPAPPPVLDLRSPVLAEESKPVEPRPGFDTAIAPTVLPRAATPETNTQGQMEQDVLESIFPGFGAPQGGRSAPTTTPPPTMTPPPVMEKPKPPPAAQGEEEKGYPGSVLPADITTENVPWTDLGFESPEEGTAWASDFRDAFGYWPWEGESNPDDNLALALAAYYGAMGSPLDAAQEALGFGGGFGGFGGGFGGGSYGGGGYDQPPPQWMYQNLPIGM